MIKYGNLIVIVISSISLTSCGPHLYKEGSMSNMRNLPLNSGASQRYYSALEPVRRAAEDALSELEMHIVQEVQSDDTTWIYYAESDFDMLRGIGDYLRLILIRVNQNAFEVRVASERKWTGMFIASPDRSDDIFEHMTAFLQQSGQLRAAEDLPQQAKPEHRRRNIAVFPLDVSGLSQNEALTLSSRLTSELFQTGLFNILEQEKIHDILEEQSFQQTGCTSSECLVEAGKLLRVDEIVGGQITRQQNTFYIYVKLVNIQSGETTIQLSNYIQGDITNVLTVGIPDIAAQLSASQ
jgi:hypothetical protein